MKKNPDTTTTDDKKLARKAKREAKKAALLEKKQKQREAKKAKRDAKKAKRLAKIEKEKQRKAAIREKKRLAREKKLAIKLAKKQKEKERKAKERAKKAELKAKERNFKNAFNEARKDTNAKKPNDGSLDPKVAAKQVKTVLSQIAKDFANADKAAQDKIIKRLSPIGYKFAFLDGEISISFYAEKAKKVRNANALKTEDKPDEPAPVDVASINDVTVQPSDFEADDEPKVELVPAGDLLNDDNAEVATIEPDNDDDAIIDDEDDEAYADSRDEQDEELVENRRDYFSNYDENGDEIDN